MRSAAVYACRLGASVPAREALIFDQLDTAMAASADLERHDIRKPGGELASVPLALPGLASVRPREPIVALGCAAHAALADFEKRTLLIDGLDLGGPREVERVGDIEAFVWSCANTSRIVALGRDAWQSIQLLPVADRRFHSVPPLRLEGGARLRQSVLVIDHEDDPKRARGLIDVLERSGIGVEPWGAGDEACWSSDALIHVHVGEHTHETDTPRLVDSWRSERIALQLLDKRRSRRDISSDVLSIEDEANGMICQTPEHLVAVCREIFEDRVLRQKLIAGGHATVAPLVKRWGTIAEDLLG